MQMQYSYRAIDKEFHEPWQRALGNVIEHALKPLLDKHTKDLYKIKNQTLMGQERGRYAPPLQRFQNNLDSFALTSSSQPFPQPPPPVFSLIFLSSAYRGSKSFLLP